jgi:hypothetical protein
VSTSLNAASPGMSAAATPDATLTSISTVGGNTSFRLVIPSLNVNESFQYNPDVPISSVGISNDSYVGEGVWGLNDSSSSSNPLKSMFVFSFGYETAPSAVPTTGTAQFSGLASGYVFKTNNTTVIDTVVGGNANLSASFSSGQITGGLTHMQQWDGMSPSPGFLPWNDVSLSANLTPGTNRFSGTTAATSSPSTAFSLTSSATGHFDGAFYGPAAQELGAVWSLSDGSKSVIGSLTAVKQ